MADRSHTTNTTVEELLSAYVDGEASAEERRRAEALLAADPAASRTLTELRYTVGLLAETPRMPVPRALTLSQDQVLPAAPSRSPWLAWLKPLYFRGAAALVAICLLILVVGDPGLGLLPQPVPATPPLSSEQARPDEELGFDAKRPEEKVVAPQQEDQAAQAAAAAPILGLSPEAMRGLQVTLALLLVALLAASFYLGRLT